MDCKIFYRISSESHPKEKLPGATKTRCLQNFMNVFGNQLVVIADNCHEDLLQHLESLGLPLFQTNLGNSGSFRHALNLATQLDPEQMVYFVEDDYLHLPLAKRLLPEALPYADYVTVYDHPDKYGPIYDGGEMSKVFRTRSGHWRFTSSTTMTFAAQVKTLREDFMDWMVGSEGDQPDDFGTFTRLGEGKGRTVAVSVPGASCHTDLTYSGDIGVNTVEDWTMMITTGMILDDMPPSMKCGASMLLKQASDQGMTKLQQLAILSQFEKIQKERAGQPK
jgi:hypothetical protein